MDNDKIGKFISDLRKKNKLTQQSFADKLGVTYQAVSKWENGKSIPDIIILKEISKQFNVSIDELISGEENAIKKNMTNKNEVIQQPTKIITNSTYSNINNPKFFI